MPAESPEPSSDSRSRDFLSVEETAARTGLSVPTVRRYVRNGKLPAAQPGGFRHRILIPAEAVEQLLQSTSTASTKLSSQQPSPSESTSLSGPAPKWQQRSAKMSGQQEN